MRTIRWVVIFAMLSCARTADIPDDILNQEKMANILTDIHLAEARVSKFNFRSMDSSVVMFNQLQQEIWTKHSVDSSLYKKSYAYYATNPELLGEIYEIVNKNLADPDSTITIPGISKQGHE